MHNEDHQSRHPAQEPPLSAAEIDRRIAALAGCSVSLAKQARLLRTRQPELFDMVARGELTFGAAQRIDRKRRGKPVERTRTVRVDAETGDALKRLAKDRGFKSLGAVVRWLAGLDDV